MRKQSKRRGEPTPRRRRREWWVGKRLTHKACRKRVVLGKHDRPWTRTYWFRQIRCVACPKCRRTLKIDEQKTG